MKNYKPDGLQAVTPCLTLNKLGEFFSFAEADLGARIISKMEHEGRIMHAEFKLDDSAGEAPAGETSYPAMLYFYVENCGAACKKTIEKGVPLFKNLIKICLMEIGMLLLKIVGQPMVVRYTLRNSK